MLAQDFFSLATSFQGALLFPPPVNKVVSLVVQVRLRTSAVAFVESHLRGFPLARTVPAAECASPRMQCIDAVELTAACICGQTDSVLQKMHSLVIRSTLIVSAELACYLRGLEDPPRRAGVTNDNGELKQGQLQRQ